MKTKHLIGASILIALIAISPSLRAQMSGTLTVNSDLFVDEAAGEIAIELRLFPPLNSVFAIDYVTEDIDAEAGKDYVAQRGILRFDAGQKIQSIRIPILDDGQVERAELFRVRLANPSEGVSVDLPDNQFVVAIADNETPASLDEDFSAAVSWAFSDLVLMPDGKLVLAFPPLDSAEASALVRLNANGAADETFHATFMPGEDLLWASALGVDKLLVLKTQPTPNCDGCGVLVRLNPDGGLDKSFSPPPQLRLRSRPSPSVLPNGKIVVATPDTPGGLARLDSDGSLDPSFQAAPVGDSIDTMLALPDQSLVVRMLGFAEDGSNRARLVRLKPDGSADPSFKAPFEFVWINQLTADRDGKFYVSARIRNGDLESERFVRMNPDGAVDAAFSLVDDPHISGNPFIVIGFEAEGRIVGHSASSRGIVRLNRDGSWDRAYIAADVHASLDGFPPQANARLLPDGRFLFGGGLGVNGRRNGLVRVNPAKVNRTSFRVEMLDCASCPPVFQAGESAEQALVGIRRLGDTTGPAAVRFSTQSLTARDEADFKPVDTILSFQPLETIKNVSISVVPDYVAEPEEALEVRITSEDGRDYGSDSRATVVIADDDRIGSRDPRYQAPAGYQLIGMQPDGKLLAGRSDNSSNSLTISRFDLNGQIDPSWREAVIPFSPHFGWSAYWGAEGRIYLAGEFPTGGDKKLIRLNSDGTIDTNFRPNIPNFPVLVTQMRQPVQDVSVQPDGTVLIVVETERAPSGSIHRIVRLKTDGSMDPSFASVKVFAFNVHLAPAEAGKVWLTGFLFSVNDTPRRAMVRLNQDGSVDETFSLPLGATNVSDAIYSHLRLSDGSFLFGGRFQFTNETRPRFLIHLYSDGRFDPAFAPRIEGRFPHVSGLAQQPDGKILLGGSFEVVGGVSRTNLARLHLDGSVDATFDAGPQAYFGPERIFLQPDGQAIAHHPSYDPPWRRFNGDKRAALVAQPTEAGRFQVEVISYSDQPVIIEASESLLLPEWRPISTNAVTAKTPVKFTDPDAAKFPGRFYRAVNR